MIGVFDNNPQTAQRFARGCRPSVAVLSLPQLVSRSQLLIETASAQAVGELLPHVIRHRKPLLVLSTSGLLRHPALLRKALRLKIPIHLPSGALLGIDGLKAAALGGLRSVILTTRKPPRALANAPYVRQKKFRLSRLRKPRLLFQGTAQAAAKAFPQNINVAATLALAAPEAKRTRVKIIADPHIRTNRHELEAEGRFGKFKVVTENRPSTLNPKTSELAVLSAVATLRRILEPLQVGT